MSYKIQKGNLVRINPVHCYQNYSQFIKRHIKYAIRWAYKCRPNSNHIYKVLAIHKHCMKDLYDDNKLCIVVEDTVTKQIYLMGEKGLTFVK